MSHDRCASPTGTLSPREGNGQPGTSTVEREHHLVLGDRFMEARNRSTYVPQEKNPKGEVHEDIGLFSWDRARPRFVLRQFHVEGFVNQYAWASPPHGAEGARISRRSLGHK